MGIGLLLLSLMAGRSASWQTDPRLEGKVTYTTVATSAQAALDGFSRACGAPLKASQTIAPSVLLLSFHDVPVKEAMAKIAEACGGTWEIDSGAYYLTRTEADERKLEAAHQAEILALDKRTLAELVTKSGSPAPLNAESASALAQRLDSRLIHQGNSISITFSGTPDDEAMMNGPSTAKLAEAVFSRLQPAMLAEAPDGHRTVFSSAPTAMERPLPFDGSDLLDAYAKNQEIWEAAIAQLPERDRSIFTHRQVDEPPAKPVKLDLVVDRRPTVLAHLSLNVELIGPDGSVLASANNQRFGARPATKVDKQTASNDLLALSDRDRKFYANLMRSYNEAGPTDPEVRNAALHPDKQEPLGTFVSDAILLAAKHEGLNVAADLSDQMLLGPFGAKATVSQVLAWVKTSLTCPGHVEGRWLVIANGGHLPSELYIERASRKDLSDLFGASSDSPSIEALSTYALCHQGQEKGFALSVGETDQVFRCLYRAVFDRDLAISRDQWQTYQLLGLLLERSAGSLPDQTLKIASLDAESQELIRLMIFENDNRNMSLQRGAQFGPGGLPVFRRMAQYEACDALPNGIPSGATLAIVTSSKSAVFTTGAYSRSISPFELANNTAQNPQGRSTRVNPMNATTNDKFRTGTHRVVTLVMDLGGGMTSTHRVEEDHFAAGDPVPYSALPEDFRKQVDDQVKRLEQQYSRQTDN